MVRLISRQRGGLAALKLTKLFGIDHFPAAKDSGNVLIIVIYCYLIMIINNNNNTINLSVNRSRTETLIGDNTNQVKQLLLNQMLVFEVSRESQKSGKMRLLPFKLRISIKTSGVVKPPLEI